MSDVLVESSRDIPIVHLSVTFRSGAVHDPPQALGLARIVARMLRRGTALLSANAIDERVDELGAELGSGVGFGTSAVSCEVLSRSLAQMVELMAEMIASPTFDERELGRLLRQAEAEIVASRDDDALLASRALRRHLFEGHPHARRTTGTVECLRAISPSDVTAFHRTHYTRANALVGISGDVDERHAVQLAERLLSGLPEGEPIAYTAPEPVAVTGRKLVVVDKPARTQTQLGIGTLGTHPRDPDHTAMLVANAAFGGTFTSRLTSEVRAKRGWSYGASSHMAASRVREAFSMWTAPSAEDAAACLELELELLQRWYDGGIDGVELAFCQEHACRSYAFEVDTAKKRLGQKLERALLDLDDDYHSGFVDRVRAVTVEQANAAIRRRIDPRGLRIAAVATEADTGARLRDAIGGLSGSAVEAFDVE